MGLNGSVSNREDGVHIFFNASNSQAELFFSKLIGDAPAQSKIISSQLQLSTDKHFTEFSIVVDEGGKKIKQVLISPDVAICTDCKNELHDINNRRYRYPFITCTFCGPRYSIINGLPYERHETSMNKFIMCGTCEGEYNKVDDRRFFSQTNSCHDCGVEPGIMSDPTSILSNDPKTILLHSKKFLEEGKILAVKGIGGYLLLCDANNPDTIKLLRNRKKRPAKPFAILYPSGEKVRNDFELNEQEKDLLESEQAPIVLLYPKQDAINNVDVSNIAPFLKRLGIMLPYSPLLDLIANDFDGPLIATSANISGSPVIYKDEEAAAYLFEIADFIIYYNRDIAVPEDDSVVQVAKYSNQKIILRRSRGYAPSFLYYHPKKEPTTLSFGAFLKSSFTLSINKNIFVSQFLGSGESYESQQMYKDTLEHWINLYNVRPAVIIADLHPGYFSHQYAIELSAKYEAAIKFVQHHEAHFAAVLAENGLLQSSKPVLGVIWDGTGFGDDGNIWGGEFFRYENNEMTRCYHFDYFPAIAGDKLARQPRIAALCAAADVQPHPGMLKEKFTHTEWNNYHSLANSSNLFTSSAGRIFDAVASLLNLCDSQTYEGEAAMQLQVLAEEYVSKNGFEMDDCYFKERAHYYRIPTALLIQGIVTDIDYNKPADYIAAKFHYSLVRLIGFIAQNLDIETICCSGGVFQNTLLVDWTRREYDGKYQVYFHQHLSPNDENISFGQMIYYDNEIKTVGGLTLKGEFTSQLL